jgi:hypothetical protein
MIRARLRRLLYRVPIDVVCQWRLGLLNEEVVRVLGDPLLEVGHELLIRVDLAGAGRLCNDACNVPSVNLETFEESAPLSMLDLSKTVSNETDMRVPFWPHVKTVRVSVWKLLPYGTPGCFHVSFTQNELNDAQFVFYP